MHPNDIIVSHLPLNSHNTSVRVPKDSLPLHTFDFIFELEGTPRYGIAHWWHNAVGLSMPQGTALWA